MAFMSHLPWNQSQNIHGLGNFTSIRGRRPEMVKHDVHHHSSNRNVEPDRKRDPREPPVFFQVATYIRHFFFIAFRFSTATDCSEAEVYLPNCEKRNRSRQHH